MLALKGYEKTNGFTVMNTDELFFINAGSGSEPNPPIDPPVNPEPMPGTAPDSPPAILTPIIAIIGIIYSKITGK